jgi:hypothetical protein
MKITEGAPFFALTALEQNRRMINFRYGNNSLKGYGHFTLRSGIERVKALFVAVPQIERNCPAPTAQPLQT